MSFTAAPFPVNETDRLAMLHGLEILDTLPEDPHHQKDPGITWQETH